MYSFMSTILHIIEISYCLMASYFFFIIAEASEQDFKNSVVRTLLFAFLKNSMLLSAGITGKILFRNQIESVVIFTNLLMFFLIIPIVKRLVLIFCLILFVRASYHRSCFLCNKKKYIISHFDTIFIKKNSHHLYVMRV